MREIKREKVWEERYRFGDEAQDRSIREMAQALKMSEVIAVLLYNRGYHTAEEAERFLRLEKADFHDPYLLADMDRAVERILTAVDQNEKIYIYGDYDVDGVTSVTALYLFLTGLGAKVGIKIPKRDGEGYGVSCASIQSMAKQGVSLVITVDTGITAHEEVAFAKTLGIDFVITDHHECHAQLPEACAVVNPHRPDCPYPFKELAGVGVVFKLLCACQIKLYAQQGMNAFDAVWSICRQYADLTAIGTIADVMPVIDENRLIVSVGLHQLEQPVRPGLDALIEVSSNRKSSDSGKRKISSGMIGFGIAPRINAAGRISDASIAVNLLLEQDARRAAILAEELCEINRQRQIEENHIAEQAYAMIEETVDLKHDRVIVLESDDWHQGIIGIVSSRITERTGLPSILISFTGNLGDHHPLDDGKGSGRSVKGMNLVEALTYCDDLLVKYGGHELAAGLTLKRANLDAFREKINEYARTHLSEDVFKIHMVADCELRMEDISMGLAEELSLLEPFGVGNSSPVFVMKNVHVRRISSIGGGKHCRLLLEKDGICLTAIYFGVQEAALGFESGDLIDALFHLDINDYKNVRSVQLILQDARVAEDFTKNMDGQLRRYEEIRGGAEFTVAENILPDRDDFARVYKMLRREYRSGVYVLTVPDMLRRLNTGTETPINYVKLKYVLRIMNELKICRVEQINPRDNPDMVEFEICFNANKTSIDKSSILKKLRSQCIDRIHTD